MCFQSNNIKQAPADAVFSWFLGQQWHASSVISDHELSMMAYSLLQRNEALNFRLFRFFWFLPIFSVCAPNLLTWNERYIMSMPAGGDACIFSEPLATSPGDLVQMEDCSISSMTPQVERKHKLHQGRPMWKFEQDVRNVWDHPTSLCTKA